MSKCFQQPNKKLNFFQNYMAHVDAVIHKHKTSFIPDDLFNRFTACGSVSDFTSLILSMIDNPLEAKLNFTTPLYDTYDYMDEVVGATLLPLAAAALSVTSAAMTLVDLFHLIMRPIITGIEHMFDSQGAQPGTEKKKQGHHCALVLLYTLSTLISALVAILSLIKCSVSLVTRPVATLIKGYTSNTEDRFGIRPESYDSSADNSDNDSSDDKPNP